MQYEKPSVYLPALRFKKGEYCGLAGLANDVAAQVTPRLIIPPPREPDPEKGSPLTFDEIVHLTGRRIGNHWPIRPAFLDPHFLFAEFRDADSKEWLPRIFKVARDAGANVIPVATLVELLGDESQAFHVTKDENARTQLLLRISYNEVNPSLAAKIRQALINVGSEPRRCSLILDFGDADLSSVEAVADIAVSSLEELQGIGNWQNIAFQATNFPDRNPAIEGSVKQVSRNEWLAWKRAIEADSDASTHLIFGDYGADTTPIFRKGGGGKPIRHYRYCTPEAWLVVRGKTDVSCSESMQWVANEILNSGHFAGADFSAADEFICGTAKGYMGPGDPTKWREINTTHHITQVVSDISKIKGFSIAKRAIAARSEQLSFPY